MLPGYICACCHYPLEKWRVVLLLLKGDAVVCLRPQLKARHPCPGVSFWCIRGCAHLKLSQTAFVLWSQDFSECREYFLFQFLSVGVRWVSIAAEDDLALLWKRRFDFGDVTVCIPSPASISSIPSACCCCCMFIFIFFPQSLEVMNTKSDIACVGASSLDTVKNIKGTSPSYNSLLHLYFLSRFCWTCAHSLFENLIWMEGGNPELTI